MDADSLSFFDFENFEYYYNQYGKNIAKKKVKFTYNRMSEQAKKLIKSTHYKNIELNKLVNEVVIISTK